MKLKESMKAKLLLSMTLVFMMVLVTYITNNDDTNNNNNNNTNNNIKNEINYNEIKTDHENLLNTEEVNDEDLYIKTSNKYSIVYGDLAYSDDYPWLNRNEFAEPYRKTFLKVYNTKDTTKYKYEWTIIENKKGILLKGINVEHTFTSLNEIPYRVEEIDIETNNVVRSTEGTIWVKYVRRELRKLFHEDKKAFLNAMKTLWEVDTATGKLMYGDDYYSAQDFANYHLVLASDRSCDHLHDGYGFFTQHFSLDLKFEQVLQLVDPSVSLHYWDFTIDVQYLKDNDLGMQELEKIWYFQEEWFGSVDEDMSIKDGLWAKSEVSTKKEYFDSTPEPTEGPEDVKGEELEAEGLITESDVLESLVEGIESFSDDDEETPLEKLSKAVNSYGYFRAPWNANPSKYVTRAFKMCGVSADVYWDFPSCSTHYNAVAKIYTWSSFAWLSSYAPHGPMHILIGGTFGDCSEKYEELSKLGFKQHDIDITKARSFQIVKNLWRYGFLDCPTGCDPDHPEDCRCSCPNLENLLKDPSIALEDLLLTPYADTLNTDQKREVLKIFCSSEMIDGDNLESVSPIDPTFWPLHPTLERLWIWKKLNHLFTDESWPDPATTQMSILKDNCAGHNAEDVLNLKNLIKTFDKETYTNKELYEYANPNLSYMPFIYDNFKWSHCEGSDYDLGDTEKLKSIYDAIQEGILGSDDPDDGSFNP